MIILIFPPRLLLRTLDPCIHVFTNKIKSKRIITKYGNLLGFPGGLDGKESAYY